MPRPRHPALTRMSVRTRLLLGIGCILAPLIAGWALTGYLALKTSHEFRTVSHEAVVESKDLALLHERMGGIEATLREQLGPGGSQGGRADVRRQIRVLDGAFADIEVDSPAEASLLVDARSAWAGGRADAISALDRRARGAVEVEPVAFRERVNTANATLGQLEIVALDELEAEIGAADSLKATYASIVLLCFAGSMAVAFLVARWLTGSILRPVSRLKLAATSLRLDELDVHVPAERADELGEVTVAFNEMAERLARNRDELRYRAFHDSLTGLPNRALLLDRIEHARARTARTNAPLGVLVLDLDDFKVVNDTLGHSVGDDLLERVAERLRSVIRDHDTPARLGGDEFAVLLEDLQEPAEAVWIAERVLAVLRAPYTLQAGQVHTAASIGVALSVAGSESGEELIRNADLAMYQAKAAGKNRIETFRPHMHAAAVERQSLEADLRTAFADGALFVQYQPLVQLDSGRVYGFEALARWEHPERGLVPPSVFIPIAEESGLIFPLGRWVLEEACAQATTWPEIDGEALTLSVNVSARQLADAEFPEIVARTIAESGLAPERLLLEITESVLARDGELAVEQLRALKALGVSIAVDDFGTGYSSLSRLRALPVDVVKIDKSFIDGVASSDGAFVSAILRLAEDIDVRTIAEGVERQEQTDALVRLGCPSAQGYLFSRPLDAAAVLGFLADPGRAAETGRPLSRGPS